MSRLTISDSVNKAIPPENSIDLHAPKSWLLIFANAWTHESLREIRKAAEPNTGYELFEIAAGSDAGCEGAGRFPFPVPSPSLPFPIIFGSSIKAWVALISNIRILSKEQVGLSP